MYYPTRPSAANVLTDVLSLLRPLACAFALSLAAAGAAEEPLPGGDAPAAPAPDPAAPAQEPGEAKPAPKKERPQGKDGESGNLFDVGHAFVEQRIFAPILRLDRFFSDEREFEAERSRSFLRWRSEVHFSEDATGPVYSTGVRANLRLPGLNKQLRRLRVVIAGETRDAMQTIFARRTTTGAPRDGTLDDDELGTGDAGVRFYLLDTLLSHADLGAGVLLRLPPGVYGRVRIRASIPVKRLFLTRTVVAGFWRTDTRLGTTTGLELERPFGEMLVSRVSGSATLTERSRGVEWISEIALVASLSAQSAAVVAASVNGASRPDVAAWDASGAPLRFPKLDRYRLYTRFRRDLYRRWFFFEIEPEVVWPWSVEKGRHPAWGLWFRIEVQFQGEEAPPPPPPSPPPEPEDPAPPDALPNEPAPR